MLCGKKVKKFMVVMTPEQKIKGKEVLPPWPKAKIMVPQSCSDLKIIKWGVYVNKCETVTSWLGLVANILSRKLSMLR